MAGTGDRAFGLLRGRLTEAIPEAMAASKVGFTRKEWEQLDARGRPLYLDHNRTPQLGELARNYVDEEDWLCVDAHVYKEHPAYADIISGKLHSMSVGLWSDDPEKTPIRWKQFVEASVTDKPVEPGARIFYAHAKEGVLPNDGSIPSVSITMPFQQIGDQQQQQQQQQQPQQAPVAAVVEKEVAKEPEQKSGATSTKENPMVQVQRPSESELLSTDKKPMAEAAPSTPAAPAAPAATPAATPAVQQQQQQQQKEATKKTDEKPASSSTTASDPIFDRLRALLQPAAVTKEEEEAPAETPEQPPKKQKEPPAPAKKQPATTKAAHPKKAAAPPPPPPEPEETEDGGDVEDAQDDTTATAAAEEIEDADETPTVKRLQKQLAEQGARLAAIEAEKQKMLDEQKRAYQEQCDQDFALFEAADKDLGWIADEATKKQFHTLCSMPEAVGMKRSIATLLAMAKEKEKSNDAPAAKKEPETILDKEIPEESIPAPVKRARASTQQQSAVASKAAALRVASKSTLHSGSFPQPLYVAHSQTASSSRVQEQFSLHGQNPAVAKRFNDVLSEKTANYDPVAHAALQRKVKQQLKMMQEVGSEA